MELTESIFIRVDKSTKALMKTVAEENGLQLASWARARLMEILVTEAQALAERRRELEALKTEIETLKGGPPHGGSETPAEEG